MSILLADLPLEILLLIFANLDTETLLQVTTVCKRLQFAASLNYLWEPRYHELYPDSINTVTTSSKALGSPTFWKHEVCARNQVQDKYNQTVETLITTSPTRFVSIASDYLVPLADSAYSDNLAVPPCLDATSQLYLGGARNSFTKAFINLALSESLGRLLYYRFILDNKSDPTNIDLFRYLAYEFGYFGYHYYVKFINYVDEFMKSFLPPPHYTNLNFTAKVQHLHQYTTSFVYAHKLSFYPQVEREKCSFQGSPPSTAGSINPNSRIISVLIGKLAKNQGFVVRYVHSHPHEIFVQIEEQHPESNSKKVLFYHANMMRIRHPQEVQTILFSRRDNAVEYSNLKVALTNSFDCLYRCNHTAHGGGRPGEEYLPSRLCTAMSFISLVFGGKVDHINSQFHSPSSQWHRLSFYPLELAFLKTNIHRSSPLCSDDDNTTPEPVFVASPTSLTTWTPQIIKLPYGFSDTRRGITIGSLVMIPLPTTPSLGVITCFLASQRPHKTCNTPEAAVVIQIHAGSPHIYPLSRLRKVDPTIVLDYKLPLSPWIGQYFANLQLDCRDPTFSLSGWWIHRLS